jgi:prophage DNA circulation protein
MKQELRHCRPQREVGLSVTVAVRAEAAMAEAVVRTTAAEARARAEAARAAVVRAKAEAAAVLPQEGMALTRAAGVARAAAVPGRLGSLGLSDRRT